jgi:hypothetical protein
VPGSPVGKAAVCGCKDASGKLEQVARVLAESLNSQSPAKRLRSETLRRMLGVGSKLETEIPGKTI